jgi:hypothetical protein
LSSDVFPQIMVGRQGMKSIIDRIFAVVLLGVDVEENA